MQDILQDIVAHKRIEVEQFKQLVAPTTLYQQVEAVISQPVASMSEALRASASGIIAEFKRRSPSRGWIREEGKADVIPLSYQQHGATALSILTDEHFFGGNDSFIRTARQSGVSLPILYKNFIIDEYQLFQARLCGASAVLLIAAVLPMDTCRSLLHTAHELGLEVLLEMHAEPETEYATLEPDLCGINNRHLGSFVTNVETSFRLAELLPREAVKVSESGISNPATVKALQAAGYQGFLIGEHFMSTDDPGKSLSQFITAALRSL